MRRQSFFILIAVCAMSIFVLPQFLSSYYVGWLIQVLIFSLFAVSLDLVVGYLGLPSLGHAAFFGVAGYLTGILGTKIVHSFSIAVALGLVGATVCACIFGFVVLRTKGAYFFMITLALAQMLWGVAFKWRSVTGGDDGFPGIPRPTFHIIHWDLNSNINYYYFVLTCVAISFIILYLVVHSPFGQAIKGIRENEKRMIVLGYNVWLYKYLTFLISGLFTGLAGILHVYYNRFVGPDILNVIMSSEGLLMVLVGGPGSLFGPFFGAAIIVILSNLVSIYTERWILILGLIYVMVILYAPQGLYRPIKGYFRKCLNPGILRR